MPIPAVLPVAPPLPAPDAQWESISLTGGDGAFWDLTGDSSPVRIQPGFTGFDAPPVSLYTDPTPGLPGASYSGYHDDQRAVFLPLYLQGANRIQSKGLRRALAASLHPSRGPVSLCVAGLDGHRRYLRCRYVSGLEGNEAVEVAGWDFTLYPLNMRAIDSPYWYGDPETPSPWVADVTGRDFFPIRAPLFTLSASQVFGGTLIDNPGDVEAYPVWTVKGPTTSVTLQLGTRIFTINAALLLGDSLVIDANPASQTITDGTGANRWADVADAAFDLWPLPAGISVVTVEAASATAATSVSMTYVPRYLTQ